MKRNLKQYIGVCLLLILSMVSGHTALAANTWKMAAKELTQNAQTNLSLQLENSDAVNAFQFDLTLPTGLKLTDKPILNATRSSGHILDWTTLSRDACFCQYWQGVREQTIHSIIRKWIDAESSDNNRTSSKNHRDNYPGWSY